jgi:hypothetical protein
MNMDVKCTFANFDLFDESRDAQERRAKELKEIRDNEIEVQRKSFEAQQQAKRAAQQREEAQRLRDQMEQLKRQRRQEVERAEQKNASALRRAREAEEAARASKHKDEVARRRLREIEANLEKQGFAHKWVVKQMGGTWELLPAQVAQVLEMHFLSGEAQAMVDIRGVSHTVDMESFTMCSHRTTQGSMQVDRQLQGVGNGFPSISATRPTSSCSDLPWRIAAEQVRPGVTKRVLINRKDSRVDVSRETYELDMAYGHFRRLCGDGINGTPRDVHSITVYDSESTSRQYNDMKGLLERRGAPTDEMWVFHGTSSNQIIEDIMSEGFKVSQPEPMHGMHHSTSLLQVLTRLRSQTLQVGGSEVGRRNGAAHGEGVYTAKGPESPWKYSSGTNRVIIARALPGKSENVEHKKNAAAATDSWSPKLDWIVFKDGHQLLPVYVVHCS